jgi:DNA-binding NtrC family response regulator
MMATALTTSRVLIIDDDRVLLQALPDTLSTKMYRISVETSHSVQEALERIVATDYDVILSDVKMPGVQGLSFLAQIRTVRPFTPILLMSGHSDDALVVEAKTLGAYAFLTKPLDRDSLIVLLKRALQSRHLGQ